MPPLRVRFAAACLPQIGCSPLRASAPSGGDPASRCAHEQLLAGAFVRPAVGGAYGARRIVDAICNVLAREEVVVAAGVKLADRVIVPGLVRIPGGDARAIPG